VIHEWPEGAQGDGGRMPLGGGRAPIGRFEAAGTPVMGRRLRRQADARENKSQRQCPNRSNAVHTTGIISIKREVIAMLPSLRCGFAFAMLLTATTCIASGGGAMPSGGSMSNFEPRELSPAEQAKEAYNMGVKLIKKAKDYDADADKASTPEKKSKAMEKASNAYNKALEQFTTAVGNQPDLVEAWNYIGFAHRHLGAYAESLEAYDHALSLNPKYLQAVEYRGEAYLGLNRTDDAKSAYMDLFRDARPLSDQLLAAMQKWVADRHQDAKGVPGPQIDAFEQWVSERSTIAKQTASLGTGDPAKNWQ
jgi:tetratricopeptide (TPR) repeat protein